ncbi:hypothetical protein SAMN02982989_3428 [Xaviernesmea oryzae]|uniref:Uncharacterized protein n=1 Tax=Xaviernesmea oryzae TaxID=464029 RepID=A0A1X7G8R0_9HYPH|nr:hypothetical protein [Xaviernesmea oryzae]SMF65983.1 hypothetical protein SAMN02982989_3428 [Xaviernesmea oryzae]
MLESDSTSHEHKPRNCTVFGCGVPHPIESGTIRIGNGDRYLEITSDGTARIVGLKVTPETVDQAVNAVLEGVMWALALKPMVLRHQEIKKRADDFNVIANGGASLEGDA